MAIRDAEASDRSVILALNDSEVPAVTPLAERLFDQFVTDAAAFRVATVDGLIGGFLVALGSGLDYRSVNYRWFEERYSDLVYVDRIVVAPAARRLGVGRALYGDLEGLGLAGSVGCEVNITPPNPSSLSFHSSLGFHEVGQQDTDGGKRVSLLRWELP